MISGAAVLSAANQTNQSSNDAIQNMKAVFANASEYIIQNVSSLIQSAAAIPDALKGVLLQQVKQTIAASQAKIAAMNGTAADIGAAILN
jgi:uncharacterized membrane-anchored protein